MGGTINTVLFTDSNVKRVE